MTTALDKFKTAAAMPVLAAAITFNPAASQDAKAVMVTLDFEQFSALTQGVTSAPIPDFDENGFHIADGFDGAFSAWGDTSISYIGDVALHTGGSSNTIITENNNSAFRVLSITLSASNPNYSEVDTSIILGGKDSNGQSFTQTFITNGFNLQEVFLNSAFENLQEFHALQGSTIEAFQISSITIDTEPTVSSVPVPAAAYLMGSALIGLRAVRYGRKTSSASTLDI